MTSRIPVCLAVCAVVFSSGVGSARGQQTPFTIRRPPTGAIVREKVRVEIPRASIPAGGFAAFFIDDKFTVALAPETAKGGSKQPFTFLWDTKADGISDGEHTIRAVLYEPAGSENGQAVNEKETSEVKLTVANKIKGNPGPLMLRYKYREGQMMEYGRDGKTVIVGGLSNSGLTTNDQDVTSVRSKLLLEVQDSQPVSSLVRNKLTSLSILTSGQETSYPASRLSGSMYQELDTLGKVLYETGTSSGMEDLAAQGILVNSTLELPRLPTQPVSIGSVWRNASERLDIPGLATDQQPMVVFENKFVGLEWQDGYPTVKIHQSLPLEVELPSVQVAGMEITNAKISYERDIYFAYKSGTLVRTVRTLAITGRSTTSPTGAGAPGGMMGAMMGGGGMAGGPPPGMGAMMQQMMRGQGGRQGGGGRGRQGMPSGGGMGGMMQQMMRGQGAGAGRVSGNTGATSPEPDAPVTVKAITTTQILPTKKAGK